MTALSLASKHVLLIGATGSLGIHLAKSLAAKGAIMSLVSRTEYRLKSVLSTLPAANGGQHTVYPVDIGKAKNVKELVGAVTSKGDVDIIVNAAGISQNKLFSRIADEEIEQILQINLMGAIWVSRYFQKSLLKASMKNGDASILNISSLLAVTGGRGASIYATSKAALLGLTRSLSAELAPKVRVNALLPGYIDSRMVSDIVPPSSNALTSKIPLGRLGKPEEVTHAALFLIENKYATNCTLNLDGGLSVGMS